MEWVAGIDHNRSNILGMAVANAGVTVQQTKPNKTGTCIIVARNAGILPAVI